VNFNDIANLLPRLTVLQFGSLKQRPLELRSVFTKLAGHGRGGGAVSSGWLRDAGERRRSHLATALNRLSLTSTPNLQATPVVATIRAHSQRRPQVTAGSRIDAIHRLVVDFFTVVLSQIGRRA